jgi:hypothetical protein
MQAAAVETMQDTCVIQAYTSTQDSHGSLSGQEIYTDGAPIACGFRPTGGPINTRPDMTVEHYDATLRLPFGTVIDTQDHIKLTHRYGAAIDPFVFRIVGNVEPGPSGIVVKLSGEMA